MRRAVFDLGSQVLPLAVAFLERVGLTALLLRAWGVASFEQWSVLLATVTMLSIVDLGSQISFSNRMAQHAQAGDLDKAVRIFRESNFIFLMLALLVVALAALVAFSPTVQRLLGISAPLDPSDQWVVLAFAVAIAAKMAMSNQSGVYRATMKFARGTVLITTVEFGRVVAMAGAVLAGYGLLGAALAMAAATVAGHLLLVRNDIDKQVPDFRYRVSLPTRFSTEGQLKLGLLYSLPFVPSLIMVQLPVIIIGAATSAAGVLASFVLLRTLSNFLRQLIQKFTFVVGMELGRLENQGRVRERDHAYRLAARFLACLFGLTTGALLGFGGDLVELWAGDRALYDPLLLAIMLSPLVLVPTTQLAGPALTYGNRPGPVAAAIIMQAAAALLLALFLPIGDIALRLTIAIFATEIVPFAPILIEAARRPVTAGVLTDELLASLLGVACCFASFLLIHSVRPLLPNLIAVVGFGTALGLIFSALMALGFYRPFQNWRASR